MLDSLADPTSGLFTHTNQIDLVCTCPDSAYLCKHPATVLYGVGVRLDDQPELLSRSAESIRPT